MASTADTHSSMASTIAALRGELPALERHQQRLETELATVSGRLEAARDALRALESLSSAPLPAQAGPAPATAEAEQTAAEPAPARKRAGTRKKTAAAKPRPAAAKKAVKKTAAPAKAPKTTAKKTTAPAAEPAPARKRTPGLTAGVLAYLAKVKEPVRATQVTEALGRETTPANVNAVRTSLERAVKASLVQRTGRGLYQALPS